MYLINNTQKEKLNKIEFTIKVIIFSCYSKHKLIWTIYIYIMYSINMKKKKMIINILKINKLAKLIFNEILSKKIR